MFLSQKSATFWDLALGDDIRRSSPQRQMTASIRSGSAALRKNQDSCFVFPDSQQAFAMVKL
jgi:hypothetical protein